MSLRTGPVVATVVLLAALGTAVTLGGRDADAPEGGTSPAPSDPPEPSVHTPPPSLPSAAPGATVRIDVGEDIQALVDENPPGSRYILASGIHRLQQIHPRDGDLFEGEPGAVLSGARVLDPAEFVQEEGRWLIGGQTQEGFAHGEMLPGREVEAHPEDLYADGERLRHVPSRSDVDGPGEWHLDYAADEIVMWDDPRSFEMVEAAVAEFAFVGEGVRDVTVENLTVRHYANHAQRGAINGRHTVGWAIRSVDASWNHGFGLGTGPGMVVEHSRFTHNGQAGMGGPGERHSDAPVGPGDVRPLQVRSNEIASNRELGFSWRWEGGGTKFSLTSQMVFTNNHVHDNGGPGIWWDIDNEDATACANLVEGNVVGIFPEIGQGARIFWNQVHDNVRPGEVDASVGIYVSNTSDVEIRENAVSGQPSGILARDADVEEDRYGPRRTTGLTVEGNEVAFHDTSGLRSETDDPAGRETTRFSDNRWWVPDPDGEHWLLNGRELDWDGWQAEGMDVDGEIQVLVNDHRPRLPDGVPRFTPSHYGPVPAGAAPPSHPAASGCDGERR